MVAMAALDAGCRPASNYARAGQSYLIFQLNL